MSIGQQCELLFKGTIVQKLYDDSVDEPHASYGRHSWLIRLRLVAAFVQ